MSKKSVIIFKMGLIPMKFLEERNITFKNESLIKEALTHSSYGYEHNKRNYERLEFLGDAILEYIVSVYLFDNYDVQEGGLTKRRANFVCEKALATYAKDMGLVPYIKVGHGQRVNDTIIADVFEAVLAAIYLDQGLEVASEYLNGIVVPYILNNADFNSDYKSMFQEMMQTERKTIEYVVLEEDENNPLERFTIAVKVEGILYGIGKGKNKKEAEQMAAADAIDKGAM